MSGIGYETALSLCEMAPRWSDAKEAEDFVREVSALLPQLEGRLPRRLYVGSSFCPQLLFAMSRECMSALARVCAAHGIALTLVIPLAVQRFLEAVNAHVFVLQQASGGMVDELVVNDYGSFVHWGQEIADGMPVSLNLGRLLSKDTRDPRDPEYTDSVYVPRLLEFGWQGWGTIERLMQTYPLAGVEFDPTHAVLDLSGLPEGVVPAVYGPLCYMSTGQICEFASIGNAVEDKFRPNATCAFQCQHAAIRYNGASGVGFVKIGRSVYFEGSACQVVGVDVHRRVFSPLLEVLG